MENLLNINDDIINEIAEEIIEKFGKKRFLSETKDEDDNDSVTIDISFEDEEIKKFFDEKLEEKTLENSTSTFAYGGSVTGGNTALGTYRFPQFWQVYNTPGVINVYSSPSATSVSDIMYEREIFLVLGIDTSQTNDVKILYMRSSDLALGEGYIRRKQFNVAFGGLTPFVAYNHYMGIVYLHGGYRPYWNVRQDSTIYNGYANGVGTVPAWGRVAGSYGASCGETRKHWLRICGYSRTYNGTWFQTADTYHFVNTGLNIKPSSPIVYGQVGYNKQ